MFEMIADRGGCVTGGVLIKHVDFEHILAVQIMLKFVAS